MFKSKHLVFAPFSTKIGDFFWYRWKNTNVLPQIFFEVKNVIFFNDFGQKTRFAGLIMLKLSTKMNQVFSGKNPRKRKIYDGSNSS